MEISANCFLAAKALGAVRRCQIYENYIRKQTRRRVSKGSGKRVCFRLSIETEELYFETGKQKRGSDCK